MTTYAANTKVSIDSSKRELETLLIKHKAHQRAFLDDDRKNVALVLFSLEERQFRIELPMPRLDVYKTTTIRRGGKVTRKNRTPQQQEQAWGQACKERWRAMVLLVKAKLELVALGVSTIEREFLADLVLPDGARMHTALADRIAATYKGGKMVPLLGAYTPMKETTDEA